MKGKAIKERARRYMLRYEKKHPNLCSLGLHDVEEAYEAGFKAGLRQARKEK